MGEIKFRQYTPVWMNGDYLVHVDEKKFHCKQFNRNPCPANLELKKDAIDRPNAPWQSLQRSYFQETQRNCQGNMKEMVETIKKFWPHLNKSNISPSSPDISESELLANQFNNFFTSVGTDLAAKIPTQYWPCNHYTLATCFWIRTYHSWIYCWDHQRPIPD